MRTFRQRPRMRVMPIEQFECSVWVMVRARSDWDGVYPEPALRVGLHAFHRTRIRDTYEKSRAMVGVVAEIILDLKQYGISFNSAGGAQ